MTTKDRLATELESASAPDWMIKNARNGQYDDFESSCPNPIMRLVSDARTAGLDAIATRAVDGEFDATEDEAEAWFQREGKDLFREQRST